MRFVLGLILGALIGFGVALWYQGEPPFAGSVSGTRGDISVTLSDRYLTRLAAPLIVSKSQGYLSHVRIASAPGDIAYVRATATAAGVSVPAGSSVSLQAVNGAISLNVRAPHVGPVPVPAATISPLLSVINGKLASLTSTSGFSVTGVGTTNSGIQVFLRQG
ncbi:MAG TPA: hypothetical protein VG815_14160 [Chloroflexota bacterium]|jgi:hypothetical protein|nr:hypothetical protein [Chloroflexota bacterium]